MAKTTKRARLRIFRDKAKEYRWSLVAANGETCADSSEGYTRKRDCERAQESAVLAMLDACGLQRIGSPALKRKR